MSTFLACIYSYHIVDGWLTRMTSPRNFLRLHALIPKCSSMAWSVQPAHNSLITKSHDHHLNILTYKQQHILVFSLKYQDFRPTNLDSQAYIRENLQKNWVSKLSASPCMEDSSGHKTRSIVTSCVLSDEEVKNILKTHDWVNPC